MEVSIQSTYGPRKFRLNEGEFFTLGSAASCDYKISHPSVSPQHLKISRLGPKLFVEDLKSAQGTYRRPQEAPFLEISFKESQGELTLRLGQVLVDIGWQPYLAPPAPEEPVVENKKFTDGELRAWGADMAVALVLMAYFLIVSKIFDEQMQGLAQATDATLRAGAVFDVVILTLKKLGSYSLLFWALVGVLPVYLGAKGIFATGGAKLSLQFGQSLHIAGFPRFLPKILVPILIVLTPLWPVVWSLRHGLDPKKIIAASDFLSVEKIPQDGERIQRLKNFYEELPGSSFLFRAVLNTQRERVLERCGGVGEQPWAEKKSCLLLLYAVSIESLEQVRPAFSAQAASHAALLLSLDGMTRIIAQEGQKSPSLAYFVNSLDLIGLGAEKEDLQRVLALDEKSNTQVLEALQGLKSRVEEKLLKGQQELGTPREMLLHVPGPLETGV